MPSNIYQFCAARTNQIKEALKWTQRKVRLNPREPDGFVQLAFDYLYFEITLKLLKMEKAIEIALEFYYPNDLYGFLAELYARLGDTEKSGVYISRIQNKYEKTYSFIYTEYFLGNHKSAMEVVFRISEL